MVVEGATAVRAMPRRIAIDYTSAVNQTAGIGRFVRSLVHAVVALASALLTTLPITPAGLGFVESAIVGILLLAASWGLAPGIDENVAASVAILDRVISYWSLIVTGIILYLITRKR